ncbi:MAG: LytR family transcriptional regulator [Streptosporangiales bacterium]|nr:LytR family transcriptional regulator [Streptosporangiales bacterium]
MKIRRPLKILGAVVVSVAVVVAGVLGYFAWRYDQNVTRASGAFGEVPGAGPRPERLVADAENWLVVGSDARSEGATTGSDAGDKAFRPGAQRADTLMLVHLTAGRDKAYIVSFPRDSWVDVPGHDMAKINAALSYGGASLLVATFEQLTGIRVDHFAAIDFQGFQKMTDAVGGVDVRLSETVRDPKSDKVFRAGVNHLNGEEALAFVRQRYGLPGGDFDRIKRQQAVLRALMSKAVSAGTLANPVKLNGLLDAATEAVTVDETLSGNDLRGLAFGLRGMRTDDVTFLTVPVATTASRGAQSVVLLDEKRAKRLYEAVRRDKVQEYVAGSGKTNDVKKVR